MLRFASLLGISTLVVLLLVSSVAAEDSSDLAKKLSNPVASLISVPLQGNFDFGIGPEDTKRFVMNVQPVIPISITDDWNLILRTILPLVDQEALVSGGEDLNGLGDVLQSFFFSPKEPIGGWIVGVGPALGYPTATEDGLGSEQWTAGPTFVVLQQSGGWTYGMLANHLWSYAGDGDFDDVSATFVQPFVSYTTHTATTIGLNTESVYDWEHEAWTVPLNLFVSQVLKLGPQPISVSLGGRYYAETPPGGPEWGLRFVFTLLFPK